MMTAEEFGGLALQLLQQATIPAAALDAAVAFRETAKALADGKMTLAPKDAPDV